MSNFAKPITERKSSVLRDFNTFFLSEVLDIKVYNNSDNFIGYVEDIAIDISDNVRHPHVSAIIVKNYFSIAAYDPLSFSEYRYDYFELCQNPKTIDSKFNDEGEYESDHEILLKRDVLDKQIVDISGMRIIRVNDVKLTFVKNGIVTIGVDIGPTGLLRRLGLIGICKKIATLFKKKIPEQIVSWQFVEPIGLKHQSKIKLSVPYAKLSILHPADIADIIEELSLKEGAEILKYLDEETAAEALSEIEEPKLQASLIETLETEKAADILEMMPPDKAADILGDLSKKQAEEILLDMNIQGANEVRELMVHDENTAGGLMTTEYISFPESFNVEQALSEFKLLAPNLESTYYIYIEDDNGKLKGVITLKKLIVSRTYQKLVEIMNRKIVTCLINEPKEQVAEKMFQYNLLSIPVVDENEHLKGIITFDDIIDTIIEIKSKSQHFLINND